MIPLFISIAFVIGVLSGILLQRYVLSKRKSSATISVKPPFKVSTVNTSSTGEQSQDRSVIYLDDQHDMDIEKLRMDEAM